MINSKLYKLSFSWFIPLGMHNLFYVTLSLITGISMQFLHVPFGLQSLFIIIPILAGLTHKELNNRHNLLFYLLPAFFFLGSFLCFLQLESQKKFYKKFCNQVVDIKGTVSSFENIQNPRFKYKIIVDLNRLRQSESSIEYKNSSNSIALYVRSKNDLEVGDYIQMNALTFKEISNTSFKNYLAKEKIVATLFLEHFEYTLIQKPWFNLNKTVFNLRESIFKSLQTKMGREPFSLFSSIFLGNRSSVKKEMDSKKESFKIWGTSHYLARSGLHLVIFVIIWHFILSLLPLSYRIKQVFLVTLILLYALLSWSSVSFERALLMVIIYKWCLLTNTPSHYVHLIVLVTFGVLLVNPLQLFFLDFQLSFGLTFALAWFNHIQSHKNRAQIAKVL
jgi:ComEC/Rec2-related protein